MQKPGQPGPGFAFRYPGRSADSSPGGHLGHDRVIDPAGTAAAFACRRAYPDFRPVGAFPFEAAPAALPADDEARMGVRLGARIEHLVLDGRTAGHHRPLAEARTTYRANPATVPMTAATAERVGRYSSSPPPIGRT